MSTKPEQKGRRSSLKTHDANQLEAAALLKLKNKRNSVSWGQSNTFQFKAMKAMFQESSDIDKPKKETEEKHKQFIESRKKSIKNEFSIVKELMKNNQNLMEEEDDDVDEEVKQNTDKNIKIGKEGLEESESSSSSDNESNEESDGKENDSDGKEKEKDEKEEKKDEKEKENNEKEKEKENENEMKIEN